MTNAIEIKLPDASASKQAPRRKQRNKNRAQARQARKPRATTRNAKPQQKAKKVELNPYEDMLINSESQVLMGLPDAYPHPTSKIRLKTLLTLPWSGGKTNAIIGRSLQNFIQTTGTVARQFATGPLYALADAGIIALVNNRGHTVGYCDTLSAYVTSGHSGEPHFSDSDGTKELISGVEYKAPCTAGDIFFTTYPSVDVTANAWVLKVSTVDANGNTTVTTGAATTGTGVSINANVTAPAGAVMYYQLELVRVAGAGLLIVPGSPNTTAAFSHGTSAGNARYPIGKADGSELSTLLTAQGKYRMLALQVLAQYRGGALSNGKIAIGQIPTSDLEMVPLPTVENLSTIPGFYNGALNKGGWCFHKPLDIQESMFEDMVNPTDDVGSLLCLAAEANSSDAEFVTLIITCTLELQTQNQVFSITPNIVDPFMIWGAHKNLNGFPNAMENPSHISRIMKKLWGDAKRASLAVAGVIRDWGPLAVEIAEFALA